MTVTDTVNRIYSNSVWETQQRLDQARQLLGQNNDGSMRIASSFMDRLYAVKPGTMATILSPAHPDRWMGEQYDQPNTGMVSSDDALKSIQRTIDDINDLLAQPDLSTDERASLMQERDALSGAYQDMTGGRSIGGWWNRNMGWFGKVLDYALLRPTQVVAASTGLLTYYFGGDGPEEGGGNERGVSFTDIASIITGDRERLATDRAAAFGADGMFFGSDIHNMLGWKAQDGGVDWSSPTSIGEGVIRFIPTLWLDVYLDPMARITFGGTFTGAVARGEAASGVLRRAVAVAAARKFDQAGMQALIPRLLNSAGYKTVAELEAAMPRFAKSKFVTRTYGLLSKHLDDVVTEHFDKINAALSKMTAVPKPISYNQLSKLVGPEEAKALFTDPLTLAWEHMDTAVNRLMYTTVNGIPQSSDFLIHTYEAAVRRRFFELEDDFADIVRLGPSEGMPAYMAGGIRFGSITGRYGWFTVPGTRGLGSKLRVATFGKAWEKTAETFPSIGHFARKTDEFIAKHGRGHMLTWLGRRKNAAAIAMSEAKAIPAINVMVMQAQARLVGVTSRVAKLAARKGVDFDKIEREVTEFLTAPAERQRDYRSGQVLIGGDKEIHDAAMREADKVREIYAIFLRKAKEYNQDMGSIDNYVPVVTSSWMRLAAEIIAKEGIDIDPKLGIGHQMLSDFIAATSIKTSFSKIGMAPEMKERTLGRVAFRMWGPEGNGLMDSAVNGRLVGGTWIGPVEANRLMGEALQDVIDRNPSLRLPKLGKADTLPLADGRMVPRVFEDQSATLIRNYIFDMGEALKEWALVSEWEKIGTVTLRKLGHGRGVKVQDVLLNIFSGNWGGDDIQKHLRNILANGPAPKMKTATIDLGGGETIEVWEGIANHPIVQRAVKRLRQAEAFTPAADVTRSAEREGMVKQAMKRFKLPRHMAEAIVDLGPDEAVADLAAALRLAAKDMQWWLRESFDRALNLMGPTAKAKVLASKGARSGDNALDALERRMTSIDRAAQRAVEQAHKTLVKRVREVAKRIPVVTAAKRTTLGFEEAVPTDELPMVESMQRPIFLQEQDMVQVAAFLWEGVEARRRTLVREIDLEMREIEAARKAGADMPNGDGVAGDLGKVEAELAAKDHEYHSLIGRIAAARREKKPPKHPAWRIPNPEWDEAQGRSVRLFTHQEELQLLEAIRLERGTPSTPGVPGSVDNALYGINATRVKMGKAQLPEDVKTRLIDPASYGEDEAANATALSALLAEAEQTKAILDRLRELHKNLVTVARYDYSTGRRYEWLSAMRKLLLSKDNGQAAAATVFMDEATNLRLYYSHQAALSALEIVGDLGGWKKWKGVWLGKEVDWTPAEVGLEAERLVREILQKGGSETVGSQAFFSFPPLQERLKEAARRGELSLVDEDDLRVASDLWSWDAPNKSLQEAMAREAGLTGQALDDAVATSSAWEAEFKALQAGAEDVTAAKAAKKGVKGKKADFLMVVSKKNQELVRKARLIEAERMVKTLHWQARHWNDGPLLDTASSYGITPERSADRALLKQWWLESKVRHAIDDATGKPKVWTEEAILNMAEGLKMHPSQVREIVERTIGAPYTLEGSGDLVVSLAKGGKFAQTDDLVVKQAIVGHWYRIAENRVKELERFMWDVTSHFDERPLRANPLRPGDMTGSPKAWATPAIPPEGYKSNPFFPLDERMGDRWFAAISEFVHEFNGSIMQPMRRPDGTWGIAIVPPTRTVQERRVRLHQAQRDFDGRVAKYEAAPSVPYEVGPLGVYDRRSLGGTAWFHVTSKAEEPGLHIGFDPLRHGDRRTPDINCTYGAHLTADRSAAEIMAADPVRGGKAWVLDEAGEPVEEIALSEGFRRPNLGVFQYAVDLRQPRVFTATSHHKPIPVGATMDQWAPDETEGLAAAAGQGPWGLPVAEWEMNAEAFAANLRYGPLGSADMEDLVNWLPEDDRVIIGSARGGPPVDVATHPYFQNSGGYGGFGYRQIRREIMVHWDQMITALRADPDLKIWEWLMQQPTFVAALRDASTYWGAQIGEVPSALRFINDLVQDIATNHSPNREMFGKVFDDALARDGFDGIAYWNCTERPAAGLGNFQDYLNPTDDTAAQVLGQGGDAAALRIALGKEIYAGLSDDVRRSLQALEPKKGMQMSDYSKALTEWEEALADERAKLPAWRRAGQWSLIVPRTQLGRARVKRAYTMEMGKQRKVLTEWEPAVLADDEITRFVDALVAHVRSSRKLPGGTPQGPIWEPPEAWTVGLFTDPDRRVATASLTQELLDDPVAVRALDTIAGIEDTLDLYRSAYQAHRQYLQAGAEIAADAGIPPERGTVLQVLRKDAEELEDLYLRLRPKLNQAVRQSDGAGKALWDHLYDAKGKLTEDGAKLKKLLKPDDWQRLQAQTEFLRVAEQLEAMGDQAMVVYHEAEKAFHLQASIAGTLDPVAARRGVKIAIEQVEAMKKSELVTNQEMLDTVAQFLHDFDGLLDEFGAVMTPEGKLLLDDALLVDVEDRLEDSLVGLRKGAKKLVKQGVLTESQYRKMMKVLTTRGNRTTTANTPGFANPAQFGYAGGPLEGRNVTPEVRLWFDNYAQVAGRISQFPSMRAAARGFQRLYANWKTQVTVGNFLSFIPRNLWGGWWNGMASGVRTVDYARSSRLLHAWNKMHKEVVGTGDDLFDTTAFRELAPGDQKTLVDAYENGIFNTFASTEFVNQMSGIAPLSTVRGWLSSLKLWNRKEALHVRAGVHLMQSSENLMRLAAFVRHYDPTIPGAGRFGASMSMAVHFDYSDLTNMERWIKDHMIPFYVWGKRNMELQVRMALERPELLMRYFKIMRNIQENFGGGDEYDRYGQPDYYGVGAVGTGLVLNADTPWWARMFIDPDLPINDLFDVANATDVGMSPMGVLSFLANMMGPQVEIPAAFLVDPSRNDPYTVYAPMGLMQALKLTNALLPGSPFAETPEGQIGVDSKTRELFNLLLPWVQPTVGAWVEPFFPLDPKTAQRYGYTPGERDWIDRLTGFAIRNSGGFGLRFATPANTRSTQYGRQQELGQMRDDMEFQGQWATPYRAESGMSDGELASILARLYPGGG